MKAGITKEGEYFIFRPRNGKSVICIQCCPYASRPGQGTPCGDWCADFTVGKEGSCIVVHRCRNNDVWPEEEFRDERWGEE